MYRDKSNYLCEKVLVFSVPSPNVILITAAVIPVQVVLAGVLKEQADAAARLGETSL